MEPFGADFSLKGMTSNEKLLSQLEELRRVTTHSQQLIDDIVHSLAPLNSDPGPVPVPSSAPAAVSAPAAPPLPQQPQSPQPQAGQPSPYPASPPPIGPTMPVAPSAPRKPNLTPEQKIVRVAAIIGSLITFAGASFGIALAIQTGLLGPVGRAVGALIFGVALLGIGIRVDTRRGPSAGVTALYITSLLVIYADLYYVTWVKLWLPALVLSAFFIFLWMIYLVLATVRNNLGLVLCMCLSMFVYHFCLYPFDVLQTTIAMVAPLSALVVTWKLRAGEKNLHALVRTATAALLAWQTLWVSNMLEEGPVNVIVVIAVAGAVMLVVSELFIPATPAAQSQNPPILNAVIMPTLVMWTCFGITDAWSVWLPVVATCIVCVLVTLTRRASDTMVNGWLIVTPLTFLVAYAVASLEWSVLGYTIYVIVFMMAFIGATFLFRTRPVHLPGVTFAWVIVLFINVRVLLLITAGGYTGFGLDPYIFIEAIALSAVLIVVATQRKLWRTMPTEAQNALAGAGLILAMVSWVSITTIIGDFVAPRPEPSDQPFSSRDRSSLTGADIGFLIGHMSVSIAVMALASWLLLKRPRPESGSNPKSARTAGLVLALVATGKLVFFDMASLSGIPRVLAFTVSGLLLIAVAVLGAQRNSGSQPQPAATAAPGAPETPGPCGVQAPAATPAHGGPVPHKPQPPQDTPPPTLEM